MSGELYWRTAERAPNGGSIRSGQRHQKVLDNSVYISILGGCILTEWRHLTKNNYPISRILCHHSSVGRAPHL